MNILLIHADQHRQDCIGTYGNKDILTPNLDALANDGVKYNEAFCPFPICTPSRYSLLSGMYAHQHLSVSNKCTLPESIKTFADALRDAGFSTSAVGKMHFTPTYLDLGFDSMVLAEQDGEGRFDDDYHRYLKEKDLADTFDLLDEVPRYRKNAPKEYWESFNATVSELECDDHSTSWISRQALKKIDNWDSGNNLLMVGFIKPHFPFDPPEPWSEIYNPEKLTLLPGWTESTLEMDNMINTGRFNHSRLTEEKMRQILSYYYANISHIDDEVGKMIALLKSKNLYDDTMIIYTSDHGDYMGYHHMVGKKNHFYDPVIRIPLIIKYPNQENKGTVDNRMNNNVDVAPTILNVAGITLPLTMNGSDLRLQNWDNDFVVSQLVCDEANGYMIRTAKYKLMTYEQSQNNAFFDLEADPFELNNLYKDTSSQTIINDLSNKLMQFVLFDKPVMALTNNEAKTCKDENVPKNIKENRAATISYYEKKLNL